MNLLSLEIVFKGTAAKRHACTVMIPPITTITTSTYKANLV